MNELNEAEMYARILNFYEGTVGNLVAALDQPEPDWEEVQRCHREMIRLREQIEQLPKPEGGQ